MKTKIAAATLFMLVLLPALMPTQGRNSQTATLPQTVLDQDAFFYGRQVTLDGTVNGNVLIIGNQVQVNGTVNGSLILIGQSAVVNGQIRGGVYALALTLDLGNLARLERDLYVATVSLTSAPESLIGRDLFALGLDAGLNGHIGRSLHTILGPIQLYNALMRLLGFDELTIRLHLESPSSLLPLEQHALRPIAFGHGWGTGFPPLGMASTTSSFPWQDWLLGRLRLWAALTAFGLLLLWLARSSLEASGQETRQKTGKTLGAGVVVLIAIINLFFLLLALYALLFAIGLGLVYLGFWQIAVALWILSLCVLSAFAVALWLFVLYGAKVVACYALFPWLFAKLNGSTSFWWLALSLLAGTLAYTLLRAIPYLGGLIDLLVTALGAGAAWLAWRHRKRTRRPRRQKSNATSPSLA